MKKISLYCFIIIANSFITDSKVTEITGLNILGQKASLKCNCYLFICQPLPTNESMLNKITSDDLSTAASINSAEYSKYGNSFFATTFSEVDSADALESDSSLYLEENEMDGMPAEVDEFPTGYKTYLYSFNPFPLPATTEIRTLLYWDPSVDIDNDEIGVYDIYGLKVSGRENITIEKLSIYNGYIIWNCSAVANGTYLIHIKHGNNSMIIKVLVGR